MRLLWHLNSGDTTPTQSDVKNACQAFATKFHTNPTSVKMYRVMFDNFLSYHGNVGQPMILEKGKEYGCFMMTAGGLVEFLLLEDEELAVSNGQASFFLVECDEVERAFEKEVLRVDENPVHRRSASKDN